MRFISFCCSINIDRNIDSMGSSIGATVDDDACFLAMFIMLSNAFLSSPRSALRNVASSRTILSSSTLKLGTVLPIYPPVM